MLPRWAGRDARSIDPAEVIELLDAVVERGSPVMANRTAALLGQLFKFGMHRRIVTATPVQLLHAPGGREKPRTRTLTDAELRAFLRDPDGATRHPKLSHVIMVLLLTGQRRGELASARWGDIDLDAGLWRIPPEQAKNGREQLVPLSAPAIEHLRGLRKLCGASAWVLPATAGERPIDPMRLSRALARCHQGPDRQTPGRFARVGIAAFTLHDLRRTCRTGLARLKVEPHIAERVLGHAQERLAATYDTHAYLDEKRAALELWAGYLQGLCGAGEGAPPPAL